LFQTTTITTTTRKNHFAKLMYQVKLWHNYHVTSQTTITTPRFYVSKSAISQSGVRINIDTITPT